MKERHVILRMAGAERRRGLGFGAAPADAGPRTLAVEVENIERSKAAAQAGRGDVVAAAPVIPMKLIAPVSTGAAAAPAAGGADWGVEAVGAVTSRYSGDGIVVAVLDTGIDARHPAFAGVTLVERNFTQDAAAHDVHGHGTHCAGTIFGRDVAGLRIGVARGVRKAIIGKVLGAGGGESEQIVEAINWAMKEGAHVISMSLGMDFPGYQRALMNQGWPADIATSRALEGYRANLLLFEQLASLVRTMGGLLQATVLVAAAGNESRRDENPDYEIAVAPPAVSQGILSVGALGKTAQGYTIAPFSNYGAMVSGPGVSITSAKAGGGLIAMSGTSMATPHVAGVAALWAEKMRRGGLLRAEQLVAKVTASGDLSGMAPGFDPADVGSGMVRAPQE